MKVANRPLVALLALSLATRLAHAQLCPIEDLDHFDEIARICCESSTGAADCSGGFPTVCTRECSMLMEPWWVACGPLIGVLGDMWAADEDAMSAFATGPCHHTNVLFANAAAGGCDAELLPVWTDDVTAACCQQNGVFECDAGVPWTCDAECAIEFVPFWEICMLSSGMGNSADLASFASLYDTCQTLPPAEGMLLMREVNNLINDPWCEINTTSIISIDQANAPCSTDESGFCARTIESGLYTCDEDYCSTCVQAHACDHSCSLPCVGQLGGPALGGAASPPVQVCETDSSRMCDRTIAAGLYDCDTDYCLTCPQAHSCDNSCSLPCGETEDGHRRNLKTNGTTTDSMEFELKLPTTMTKLNKAAVSSSRKSRRLQDYWQATPETNDALFDVAPINQIACPLSSFVDRAQEVEAQCCHNGRCPNGMPDDCAFDCGRFFTSFMVDCNQTIHYNFDRLTIAEYIAFGDECSRMDPLSMIRAIDGAFCTTCGDNITQAPLEQCDWGAGNSYEPNSCRPGCQLPSCGDGVIDTEYEEGCDDGEMNAEDGDCLPNCQLPCPRPPPVDGMTVSMTAGLAPGSVATFSCDNGQLGNPLTCQADGSWSGDAPGTCAVENEHREASYDSPLHSNMDQYCDDGTNPVEVRCHSGYHWDDSQGAWPAGTGWTHSGSAMDSTGARDFTSLCGCCCNCSPDVTIVCR